MTRPPVFIDITKPLFVYVPLYGTTSRYWRDRAMYGLRASRWHARNISDRQWHDLDYVMYRARQAVRAPRNH